MKKLWKTVKKYFNNDAGRGLASYAENDIEYIALMFIALIYACVWFVSHLFLLVTCPLWVIPYSIYKSKEE